MNAARWPELVKRIKTLEEENARLKGEIDRLAAMHAEVTGQRNALAAKLTERNAPLKSALATTPAAYCNPRGRALAAEEIIVCDECCVDGHKNAPQESDATKVEDGTPAAVIARAGACCSAEDDDYGCTRPPGHAGEHRAFGLRTDAPLHRWPASDSAAFRQPATPETDQPVKGGA